MDLFYLHLTSYRNIFKDQTFLRIEDDLHKNMEEDSGYVYEFLK